MKDTSKILISACLLGEPCRFDGQGKYHSELLEGLTDKTLVPFCPEVEGGLPTPRPAAEISGNRVLREDGSDVTPFFLRGAKLGVEKARQEGVELAILKSRSPACGCRQVYDGTFSKTMVSGDGMFTRALKARGIKCVSDEDFLANNR